MRGTVAKKLRRMARMVWDNKRYENMNLRLRTVYKELKRIHNG